MYVILKKNRTDTAPSKVRVLQAPKPWQKLTAPADLFLVHNTDVDNGNWPCWYVLGDMLQPREYWLLLRRYQPVPIAQGIRVSRGHDWSCGLFRWPDSMGECFAWDPQCTHYMDWWLLGRKCSCFWFVYCGFAKDKSRFIDAILYGIITFPLSLFQCVSCA